MREWLVLDGKGIELVGEYLNAKTKVEFRCSRGHEWATTPACVKQGTGCPTCSMGGFDRESPAWGYVFERAGYIKYGITNNLTRRLTEHRMHGELVLRHERYYETGQHAIDWENFIKRTYGGRYVTKEQCHDGYTETLPIPLLEIIIN